MQKGLSLNSSVETFDFKGFEDVLTFSTEIYLIFSKHSK